MALWVCGRGFEVVKAVGWDERFEIVGCKRGFVGGVLGCDSDWSDRQVSINVAGSVDSLSCRFFNRSHTRLNHLSQPPRSASMSHGYDTMMTPSLEDLLERTESKFKLTTLAAKRSRGITEYLGQLGTTGSGALIPPQVISTKQKPLSIALEEIAAGKIRRLELTDEIDELDEQGDLIEGADAADVTDEAVSV